jgi:hypothetical protein
MKSEASCLVDSVRIAVVGKKASQRGGESVLAHHYFKYYRSRAIDAYLIVDDIGREELLARFPEDEDRLIFIDRPFVAKAIDYLARR